MKLNHDRIVIETEEDLLEIMNIEVVAVIKGKEKPVLLKREKDQIVLYENDCHITQSHYTWYLKDMALLFLNVESCQRYLQCELIAKSLHGYRICNGHAWKSKLLKSFENGTNTEPGLQRFRNRYDSSLLKKIQRLSVEQTIDLLITKEV